MHTAPNVSRWSRTVLSMVRGRYSTVSSFLRARSRGHTWPLPHQSDLASLKPAMQRHQQISVYHFSIFPIRTLTLFLIAPYRIRHFWPIESPYLNRSYSRHLLLRICWFGIVNYLFTLRSISKRNHAYSPQPPRRIYAACSIESPLCTCAYSPVTVQQILQSAAV